LFCNLKFEINDVLKTIGRYASAITDPNHKPQFLVYNALFATGNKHTANDESCLRMSAISYVVNADSGRYADALISYTGANV